MASREEMLALMKRKDDIEREIGSLHEILQSEKNVGMKEPLVDDEGYPRSDIDVCLVRQTRHRVICLQNDHKALMGEIEVGLHHLHAQQREQNKSVPQQGDGNDESNSLLLPPFAKVDKVEPQSPACSADLRVGDEIAKFGSIVSSNFTDLSNIGTVVHHSIGRNKPMKSSGYNR